MNRLFTGIMACTKSGVIGLDGKIPWRYESEFKHFQNVTEGKTLIMGRKTFDEMLLLSLLKTRNSIIFTRNPLLKEHHRVKNLRFVHSLNEFNKISLPQKSEIYMIGGGSIAELFLRNDMLKEILLTKVHKEYNGDSYFPISLIATWNREIISSCSEYTIYRYTKN